jgi:hypothetical protein
MWVNRHDLENADFLFYVGTGDGFSGTGAELYMFGNSSGQLAVQNYGNSTLDADVAGGSMTAGRWHHVGLVRNGSSLDLYLDGSLVGSDSAVSIQAFNSSANSVAIFGAAKWMRLDFMRTRVLDGLIDQIEIFNHAMSSAEVNARYAAVVPEQSAGILLVISNVQADD